MKKILLFVLPFFFVSCDKDSNNNNGNNNDEERVVNADELLDEVLHNSFDGIVNVHKDSKTYTYLLELAEEAIAQSKGKSSCGLPLLYKEENFPTAYNYYTDKQADKIDVYKTMIGWLAAMQLSEINPSKRNLLP